MFVAWEDAAADEQWLEDLFNALNPAGEEEEEEEAEQDIGE